MEMSNRDFVARALEVSIDGLGPFVVEVLAPLIPAGTSWTDLLEARDRSNGIVNKTYNKNDLQGLLRMITERLGNLGFPFSARLPRLGQNLASELRDVRNRWAHHDGFSDDDTYRAIDTTERLLRSIGAVDAAHEATELRLAFRPLGISPGEVEQSIDPAVDTPPEGAADPPEPIVAAGAISIQLDVIPVLSYAAAHNQLPIVSSITITNAGVARRGAVLKLEASSALGIVSRPFEQLIDLSATLLAAHRLAGASRRGPDAANRRETPRSSHRNPRIRGAHHCPSAGGGRTAGRPPMGSAACKPFTRTAGGVRSA